MLSDELVTQLRQLNHVDKLRAMQLLVNEMASEAELLLSPHAEYAIFTPLGNEAAAQSLFEALNTAEKAEKKIP